MAKLTDSEVLEIVKECAEGRPQREVAASRGIDKRVVSKIVTGRTFGDVTGIPYLPSRRNLNARKLFDCQAVEIVQRAAAGASVIELADAYDVHPSTVRDVLAGRSYAGATAKARRVAATS